MGMKQQTFLEDSWKLIQSSESKVYANIHTGQQIQERLLLLKNNHQLHLCFQNIRTRTENQADFLVKLSKYFKGEQDGICNESTPVFLYFQRIPTLLADIDKLSHQKSVKILNQSLQGFSRLKSIHSEGFPVTHYMIGLNNQGQTRVWLDQDFSRFEPSSKLLAKGELAEQSMIKNIYTSIQMHRANGGQFPSDLKESLFWGQSPLTFKRAIQNLNRYMTPQNQTTAKPPELISRQITSANVAASNIRLQDSPPLKRIFKSVDTPTFQLKPADTKCHPQIQQNKNMGEELARVPLLPLKLLDRKHTNQIKGSPNQSNLREQKKSEQTDTPTFKIFQEHEVTIPQIISFKLIDLQGDKDSQIQFTYKEAPSSNPPCLTYPRFQPVLFGGQSSLEAGRSSPKLEIMF